MNERRNTVDENISFDQKTLNTFWQKAEEVETISNVLITELKPMLDQEEINSSEIINLIKMNSGEQNA